jgi:hypothetical protein
MQAIDDRFAIERRDEPEDIGFGRFERRDPTTHPKNAFRMLRAAFSG